MMFRETLNLLVNALVFNSLFYCSTGWSNVSMKDLKKLQRVQKFACRVISWTQEVHL